ncbi:MAG: FHA domain-containing protein [Sandaracinaceae bacterium]|nr:FHA domain-containing protein [Sandaracinaceae bacterium]
MSWLKRIFDNRHRRARAAEGAGQWRRAASIWAEAGEPERAAEALIHLAERGGDLEARLEAWHDALRWLPEDEEERREEIERRMGMAVLEDARLRGATSAEEKRRLFEAAGRLERFDRPTEAAEAFALLGRKEDQARCLELAGEVEQLEALLSETNEEDERESQLRRFLADYESALRFGARLEARQALHEASRIAPDERSVSELLRRLETRMPPPYRVRLSVRGKQVSFVGRLPAVVGRGDEVEVRVRGTSVSRRHAEVALHEGALVIRDLDSRNGTLVQGVPVSGAIELAGPTEVGLGDDVTLDVRPEGGALIIDVRSGFDRGAQVIVGQGALRLPDLAASLAFEAGWPVLTADEGAPLLLDGQTCALPVHLLIEDRLEVAGLELEVLE